MKKNSLAKNKAPKVPIFVRRAERAFQRVANNVRAQNRTLQQPIIGWKDGKTVAQPV